MKDLHLHSAVKSRDMTLIKSLLSDPNINRYEEDCNGVNAFVEACILGYGEVVLFFLSQGFAAQPSPPFRHTPLRGACVAGKYHIIPLLLEHGADPNALSDGKRSPLMGACFLRKEVQGDHAVISELCVRALLNDSRTDPTLINSFGESALDLAKIRGYKKSAELISEAVAKWSK